MSLLEHAGRGVSVDAGEIVSVLGAPGSGKTRLGLELAYLARPQIGSVLFHGADAMALRRRADVPRRPREITMLVQNAEDQLFAKTVFDDVGFGPRRLGISVDEVEERVVRALQAVELDPDEVRGRSPFALSGGERRRVALAGVLAMEPEVLILDEPTANLDAGTRHEFLKLLQPLRGRSAIVWLTSSAQEAGLADRIYLLRNGEASEVEGGATHLLDTWKELSAAGIELPGVYELAAALERRGCRLPDVGSPERLTESMVEIWKAGRDDW